MQSKILLLSIFFLVILKASSQSCFPNGLFLSVQSQVDQFASQNPGCKIIEGGLNVNGADITHLDGLSQLTEIKGDVYLTNCDSLRNINGLQNITEIGGAIRLQGLPSLTSINFSKLEKSTGDFFYISSNPLVSSIQLNVLDSVYGIFQIWSMDTITDLNGLNKLSYVGKDFAIFKNRNMMNINGLTTLTHIADGLRLYENTVLQDVSGLPATLKIAGPLVINDNPKLAICNTAAICAYLENPSSFVVISDNDDGCNNIPEVEIACISSTENEDIDSAIHVYPNPANDYIIIENPVEINSTLNIRDISGRVIIHQANTNEAIDIQHLSPGMYILETRTNKMKFIVER
ncbi:MAG TPA: T9SS type A sorting domain-containing protein [Saprospiraceae bacterium]|nr:T9SS type A sorting domain-containing protein [Saprospiraceae bacterium]HMU02234.1 T9SS type A sorting domain-containing protein [Saprospiraceae bacterium]